MFMGGGGDKKSDNVLEMRKLGKKEENRRKNMENMVPYVYVVGWADYWQPVVIW